MQLNPIIQEVEQTASDEITVTFSKHMAFNSDLQDPSNYIVYDINSEVVTDITGVTVISSNEVVLLIDVNDFIYEDTYYVWVNPYDGPVCADHSLKVGVYSNDVFGAIQEPIEIDPSEYTGVSIGVLDTTAVPTDCAFGMTINFTGAGTPKITIVDLETGMDLYTGLELSDGTTLHRIRLEEDKLYDIYLYMDGAATNLEVVNAYFMTIEGNYNIFSGVPIPSLIDAYMEYDDEMPNAVLWLEFNVRVDRTTIPHSVVTLTERSGNSIKGYVTANITGDLSTQHRQLFRFMTTRLTHNGNYEVEIDYATVRTELGWEIDGECNRAITSVLGVPLTYRVYADSEYSLMIEFSSAINITDEVRNLSIYQLSNGLRCLGLEILDNKTIRLLTTRQDLDSPYTLKIGKVN